MDTIATAGAVLRLLSNGICLRISWHLRVTLRPANHAVVVHSPIAMKRVPKGRRLSDGDNLATGRTWTGKTMVLAVSRTGEDDWAMKI